MTPARLLLSQRHVRERRVLDLLRGAAPDMSNAGFARLALLAARQGLAVQSGTSRYVTLDELCLLRWLAEAQRRRGLKTYDRDDAALRSHLCLSAAILKRDGLVLPPLTLSVHHAGGAAPSHAAAWRRPSDR